MKYGGVMRFTKSDNIEFNLVKMFYSPAFIEKYQNEFQLRLKTISVKND